MLSLILLYNLTWHCFTATQYRINLQYTKLQEQYLFIDLGSLCEKRSLHKTTEPKTQSSIFCLIEQKLLSCSWYFQQLFKLLVNNSYPYIESLLKIACCYSHSSFGALWKAKTIWDWNAGILIELKFLP